MKHRHLISLILTILFLAAAIPGCGPAETDEKPESSAPSSVESKAQSAPAPSPTPEPTPYVDPEGLTGQLTLLHFTSTGTSEQLDAMAEEFMEIHPGVTIKTEYGVDSDTLTAENGDELRAVYDDRVRAELENGEADYILVNVPDSLPIRRLTRDNLLLDLTSYWENDASIDPADYFTSVLDAYSIDGKLSVFPLDFCFMGAYLNRPLMEQLQVDVDAVDSIDFNMLMEWYKAGCQLQPDLQFSFGGWMQENIFSMERSAYMDIETGTASFLSPAFLEFLNTTGSIEEGDQTQLEHSVRTAADFPVFVNELIRTHETGDTPSFSRIPPIDEYVEKGNWSMMGWAVIDCCSMAYISQPFEYLAGPYPLVDTKGQLSVDSYTDFAFPASMKNPELAWRFMSYCLQERKNARIKGGNVFTTGIPLNKKNLSLLARTLKGDAYHYAYERMLGHIMNKYDPDLTMKRVEAYLSMPLVNVKLYSFDTGTALKNFYKEGTISAEQCAKEIQMIAEKTGSA